LNKTILNSKPPIFWKDREIIKRQITKWKIQDVYNLIFDLNEIELQIKKNFNTSVNIVMNFLLEKADNKS
jgi:DNA polymerase-3 subunit delta